MAAPDFDVLLRKFAGHFKTLDPQAYEQFLRTLDGYTHRLTVAVTMATTDEVLRCQGRAQQAMKFLELMDATAPSQPPSP